MVHPTGFWMAWAMLLILATLTTFTGLADRAGSTLLPAVRGFLGSLVCVAFSLIIGRWFIGVLKLQSPRPLNFVLHGATGAALLSIVAMVISLFHLAYPPVFVLVLFGSIPLCRRTLKPMLREIVDVFRTLPCRDTKTSMLAIFPMMFSAYAFLCALVSPYCTDSLSYHLVIPRDILWNHGFVFNPFAYQSGMALGWHLFGVFAYVLGGPPGFNALTAWAFCGLLVGIYGVVKNRYAALHGMAAACLCAFLLHCVINENDRTGIDVPVAMLEWSGLFAATSLISGGGLPRAVIVGLMAGSTVAGKLTALPGALLILAVYLRGQRAGEKTRPLALAASLSLGLGVFWPLITFLHTGSPLPQMALSMRTQGPPLPQLGETLEHDIASYHEHHMDGFLSLENALFAVLIAGGLLLLLRNPRDDGRLSLLLGSFALARWLMLGALSSIAWFHLRYNLVSVLCLGAAASVGWAEVLSRKGGFWKKGVALLIFIMLLYASAPSLLFRNTHSHLRDLLSPPGARTSHVACFNWISSSLPKEAVIAGPAIETFHAQRRYIQMQGISQERIDLKMSPEEILANLTRLGVTHVHISNEYDLPPWSARKAGEWLKSFDGIASLPGVEPVYKDEQERWDPMSEQMVRDRVYRIKRSGTSSSPYSASSNS